MFVKCIVLFLFLFACDGYKVLIMFPIPGKSHAILGEGYVRNLLEAGHEITYITPIPIKDNFTNLRQIDVSVNKVLLPSQEIFDVKKLMNKEINLQNQELVTNLMLHIQNATLHTSDLQALISNPNEKFDAVIVEWLYNEMSAGLAAVFDCPLIWSSSMTPHTTVLALIDEHLNPAYNLHHLSRKYSFSFMDRVESLWKSLSTRYYLWNLQEEENEIFKSIYGLAFMKRGRKVPEFNDVRYNGSIMLGNSHYCVGDNIALPQNYINIGGYHLKDVTEPLPKNIQNIMDKAQNGVIYFSLGTMLQSSKMADSLIQKFMDMFGELRQTVIWKLEHKITQLPKNVHTVTWAPQQSILAHPNCKLFITHGGLLSIIEAINYGVPIIGVPFFADQFLNTDKAVARGFALRMDLSEESPVILKDIIEEIIYNASYNQRAKELSAIYHNRMTPPGKELVFWVEYTIKTRGAAHLRSRALQVEWYKKIYLDLIALLVIFIVLLPSVVKHLCFSKHDLKVKKQ